MIKKKILFIQPRGRYKVVVSPPLGLLRLATITPSEFSVQLIDENLEQVNFDKVDLVAITVQSFLTKRAYKIADGFRKIGVKVILGGIHASAVPEEARVHADSVVVGEADSLWAGILKDFSEGNLKKIYECDRPSLEGQPLTNWKLIEGKKYVQKYVMQTSRGCPFGCDFCSVSLFNGKQIRHKPVREVIDEIKYIKSIDKSTKPAIFFVDDNIVADKKYSKELFRELIPLNIKWYGQSPINITEDEELLDLVVKSGCSYLFIGFESINQGSLEAVHKPFKVSKYEVAIKKIKEKGILIHAAFIFGMDSDDKGIFRRTVDFCNKNKIDFVAFHPLNPFPGTDLFKKLEKEGRLLPKGGLRPKLMTYEELIQGTIDAYYGFYSIPLIIKRTVRSLKRSMRLKSIIKYFALNMIFRRTLDKVF